MISTYTHKKTTWVDLQNPSSDEIQHLIDVYDIPEMAAAELSKETLRGKLDFYEKENVVYLDLHFPTIMQGGDKNHNDIEIGFIIGKNYIITNHHEEILSLKKFSRLFDVDSILNKSNLGDHAGFMFFNIARELYQSSIEQLKSIDTELDFIEDQIFENKEEKMVRRISELNRKLVDFKQAINVHDELLGSFEGAGAVLFGEGFEYYLSNIMGEQRRVKNIIESHKDMLRDLKDTNDSLLANKTNKVMKALTVMSFIMLPLTLITGVFGMNTGLVLSEMDFYRIIGIMTIMGIVMFVYFNVKRWF